MAQQTTEFSLVCTDQSLKIVYTIQIWFNTERNFSDVLQRERGCLSQEKIKDLLKKVLAIVVNGHIFIFDKCRYPTENTRGKM